MLKHQHRPACQDPARHGPVCEDPACDGPVRNHYFPRKLMTAADFGAEQRYMIERRRMLNRALHGWGVVGGLDVALEGERLHIAPGVALDRHGREIVLAQGLTLDWCDVMVDGCHQPRGKPHIPPGHWLLSAHYAEKGVGQVRIPDACGCGDDEWNSICETVVFSLTPLPDCGCACGDPGCPGECGCVRDGCFAPPLGHQPPHDHGEDPKDPRKDRPDGPLRAPEGINTGPIIDELDGQLPDRTDGGKDHVPHERKPPEHVPPHWTDPAPPYPRGPHAVLCCWSGHAEVLEAPGHLCEWRGLKLDPCDGVALACFAVTPCETGDTPPPKYGEQPNDQHTDAGCGKPGHTPPQTVCCDPKVEHLDACTPRRFVKRTDLLFDLIRGCDLTRIVALSWQPFVDAGYATWRAFGEYFTPNPSEQKGGPRRECPTRLSVEFSGPVYASTITAFSFTITASFHEGRSGWFEPKRVPIVGFTFESDPQDPQGTVRRASAIVDWGWWRDEIDNDDDSDFTDDFERPAIYPIVDIDIDGNRIIDCRGQPVAAGAFGPRITPTGNGLPGGVCRSSFRIAPNGTAAA